MSDPALNNQNKKISLVLADVDGTLVTPDKALTERAKSAVRKLADAKIHFTITSGRPPLGMKFLVEELELTAPVAAFNGALFMEPDYRIINELSLNETLARRIIKRIEEFKLDVWVYTDNDWLVRDPEAPHVAHEAKTVKFEPQITENFDPFLNGALKIVGVSDDHALVAECEIALQKEFGGDVHCNPKGLPAGEIETVSATRSQPYYLDVTHPAANKGNVVHLLADYLKIPPEEIITIGDMANDVLMFRESGSSIAMGNSSREVQQAATFVTEPNTDEGFARAVEKYILQTSEKE